MITRRKVLGWAGAAAMGSVLPIRVSQSKIDPPIDYSKFTYNYARPFRYSIENPFEIDGITYATDGGILVCHEQSFQSCTEQLKLPPIEDLWWDEFDTGGWRKFAPERLPAGDYSEEIQCGHCDDELGHSVLTDEGTASCPKCDGAGVIRVEKHLAYTLKGTSSESCFDDDHINAIRSLGDVEYKIFLTDCEYGDYEVLAFRFGETGKGFLMSRYVRD